MFLGVTGMLMAMPYTDEERRTIAQAVRHARVEKALDKEGAAKAAHVSSITWKRAEDGEGVRDVSLGKILRSLELGDADALVSGKTASPEPIDLSTVPPEVLAAEVRRRLLLISADYSQRWNIQPPSNRGPGASETGA